MRQTLLRASLAVMLCMALASVVWAAPVYNFLSVASPGDRAFTQLLGINNSGTIAGYFGDGMTIANNGFTLVLPNTFTAQNFPMATQTQVIGINNTGMTAGFYVDNAMPAVTHGFTFNGTIFTTVDAPGTAFNQLLGVNDGGTVVGYSSTDPTGMTLQKAFYSSGGVFTYIPNPTGTGNNQAVGINNAGTVVGFYQDSMGVFHGFLFMGGAGTTFDVPGAMDTQAFGINNHGEIVGDYTDSMKVMHGFVFIGGHFYTVDDPSAMPGTTTINGLNDKGQLVGFYVNANDKTIGFFANPVPEPGSLALLGSGMLAGFGFLRRRLSR